MKTGVRRPILIVGSGRSGTTALYEALCRHPDVAWFSNYTDRWPRLPQLAALSKAWGSPLHPRMGRLRPVPSEGYHLWDRCLPATGGPLSSTVATEEAVGCIRSLVEAHLRYQGKTRFINKNTRNTVRMALLEELFDEPIFIHVLRDPRATVASLLKVAWWPDLPIWCRNGITATEWEGQGRNPAELAAHLWVAEVRQALEDAVSIPSDRYLEVRYEDFVSRPKDVLLRVMDTCELRVHPSFDATVESLRLDNRNHKFRQQLSAGQIAAVEEVVAEVAGAIGYELSSDRPSQPRDVP